MIIERYEDFLKSVEDFEENFNSIKKGSECVFLALYFWSFDEIVAALTIRSDWDVSEELIPFYGDWHDLYCLNALSGEVVHINDSREILYTWQNIEDFKQALSHEEIEETEVSGVVEIDLKF